MILSTYHKKKVKVINIVREYFPKCDLEYADYILWNKTGWPSFWHGDPETCLREQLLKYSKAVKQNKDVCYGCGKIKAKDDMNCGMCFKCQKKLKEAL